VYVGGEGYVTIDHLDYIALKYRPAGAEVWETHYYSTYDCFDVPAAMVVDNETNVYLTGRWIAIRTSPTSRSFPAMMPWC